MNIETFREYCLAKKGVTEELPFDPHTLVFKVMGKMFALTALERMPAQVNLKCDPDHAIELREQYDSVQPGYHMSKKHWNTVMIETGEVPENELRAFVDQSYDLVVKGLTKKLKAELENL